MCFNTEFSLTDILLKDFVVKGRYLLPDTLSDLVVVSICRHNLPRMSIIAQDVKFFYVPDKIDGVFEFVKLNVTVETSVGGGMSDGQAREVVRYFDDKIGGDPAIISRIWWRDKTASFTEFFLYQLIGGAPSPIPSIFDFNFINQ